MRKGTPDRSLRRGNGTAEKTNCWQRANDLETGARISDRTTVTELNQDTCRTVRRAVLKFYIKFADVRRCTVRVRLDTNVLDPKRNS